VWLGDRVHVRLAPATAARLVAALLFVIGVSLIARTL
jgi:hypothetical protein